MGELTVPFILSEVTSESSSFLTCVVCTHIHSEENKSIVSNIISFNPTGKLEILKLSCVRVCLYTVQQTGCLF